MFNFTGLPKGGSSSERGPKQLSEAVLSNLEKIVAEEMEAIDPEDVADSLGISAEEVVADKKYVEEIKVGIDHGNDLNKGIKAMKLELEGIENNRILDYKERLGEVFEGFLYKHIGESRIFKNVILHKTAEYDDLRNGVDFVAEYENPDKPSSYIGLAMDASFASYAPVIDKKMLRSLGDIKNDTLSKIKYFQFDSEGESKDLGIPRVIVGTDETHVKALLEKWDLNEKAEEKVVSFEENPVWTIIALQIVEQLKMFIKEAESHGQEKIGSICRTYLVGLEKSLRDNKDLVAKHEWLAEQDKTHVLIKKFCADRAKELDLEKAA
jgi:hypothetical protein